MKYYFISITFRIFIIYSFIIHRVYFSTETIIIKNKLSILERYSHDASHIFIRFLNNAYILFCQYFTCEFFLFEIFFY